MAEKLKPLAMGFNEALTRLARVPKGAVESKAVVKDNSKKGAVKKPRPLAGK